MNIPAYIGKASLDPTSKAISQDTFVTPLQTATGRARELLERLRGVADRLDGGFPSAENDTVSEAECLPGVFGEVRGRSEAICRMLAEAEDIVMRIARSLP